MSETAPTVDTSKTADQFKIDRLEALAAKRKSERNQNELFGKYDPKEEGPANVGERTIHRSEDSHETYHAQLPSEGIYRDGAVFRRAGGSNNGEFASAAAYNEQNGLSRVNTPNPTAKDPNPEGWTYHESDEASANRYYDNLIGGNEAQDVAEVADYENMSVDELTTASAKAIMIGDRAEAEDIHAIFEHLLMQFAIAPESRTDVTDQDYQKEVERFDRLVEIAVERQKSKNPDAATGEKTDDKNERRAKAAANSEPFVEDEDEKPADGEKPANENEGTKPEETDPNEAPDETPEKEHKVGDTAEYNGETVTLGQKLAGTDKMVAYEVVKSDGSRTLVYEHELTFPDPAAEKESVGEKAKRFWKKGTSFIAEKFTMGYMGARWFVEDSIINRGIDPLTTSFEDAEKIKHRRRIALVAGTAAVLVALAISRDFHGFGSGGGGSHVANALPTDTPTPSPSASGFPTSDGSEFTPPQTQHAPELNPNDPAFTLKPVDQAPTGTPSPDVLGAAPTPDSLSNPGFTITQGEGGLQLFNRLDIDPAKWAANASRLLQQHGEDFYTRPGGGIGISHPGALSEATRIDLLNIKNS